MLYIRCVNRKKALSEKNEMVVLLHGILRSSSCMRKLEEGFLQAGYKTLNIDYPSKVLSIEELASNFLPEKLKTASKEDTIHFVTHSMGGLIVRTYLAKNKLPHLGRVVMLSPPNHGSELADFLKKTPVIRWLYRKIFGPAGQQLGTGHKKFAIAQENINFELGIIGGTRVINPLGYFLIKEPSDGTVSVASTKITGMKAHMVLPVDHLLMVKDKELIRQTMHFIQHGEFNKTST
jgi:pimeloyl-ACP methyl ester carboxylesterase